MKPGSEKLSDTPPKPSGIRLRSLTMAPPTGPRGGTNSRREGREGGRGARGGGITKRRGNVGTDRDGDVSMDAPAGGSGSGNGNGRPNPAGRGTRGAGRGSRGTTRTSSRIAQNVKNYVGDRGQVGQLSKAQFNRATLKVYGLKDSKASTNADGGVRSLVDFIERKASRDKKITISKYILDGDYVWLNVNKDDLSTLLHLDGFTYAGAPLTITETSERMPVARPRTTARISGHAEDTRQQLKAVLATRYIPETKLLDLSSLENDPILSKMDIFSSQKTAEKVLNALMLIASDRFSDPVEKKEAIQAVTIAGNNLKDVQQVYQLSTDFPDLKRLDISNNTIESMSGLAKWRGQFRSLEELHLTGNAVVNQANYVAELLDWFPVLQILNGQQVRTPEQAAESLDSLIPKPLPQFPSNVRDDGGNVTESFVQVFFPLFDNDRAALAAQFYDDESWFSLSVIPGSGRPLPWKSYLKYSRNVERLRGHRNAALVQRLFTGGDLIADMWKTLPPTQHPALDSGRWIIDSHTFPNLADPSGHGIAVGLMIIINGQYEEADPAQNLYGTRNFSRTIILGPSKPNNPPPPHPYRVISDQLSLHGWKPRDAVVAPAPAVAVAPGPVAVAVVPGPVAVTVPGLVAGPVVLDDALRMQLTEELSRRTGMTLEYSNLCLSGAPNWNFEAALRAFDEQKGALPATAFINGVIPM